MNAVSSMLQRGDEAYSHFKKIKKINHPYQHRGGAPVWSSHPTGGGRELALRGPDQSLSGAPGLYNMCVCTVLVSNPEGGVVFLAAIRNA